MSNDGRIVVLESDMKGFRDSVVVIKKRVEKRLVLREGMAGIGEEGKMRGLWVGESALFVVGWVRKRGVDNGIIERVGLSSEERSGGRFVLRGTRLRGCMTDGRGNIVVVGSKVTIRGDKDGYVAVVDSDGHLKWQLLLGGGGEDILRRVCIGDGKIVAVGSTESYGGGDSDIWVACLTMEGKRVWEKVIDKGGDEEGCDVGYRDKEVIILGTTNNTVAGERNIVICRTGLVGGRERIDR